MRRLESSTSSLRSGMNALVAIQGAQLFGSIASAAGGYIRSLVAMGQAQAEVIDQQSKLAARLGMTYGEFSGLALAGDLAGVGMDTIANAATKADVAFVKAVNGSSQARAAFAGLGLSLDELGQMSAAERFQAISAAIAALPTEAQRSAAAVQLFGRAGAQLLPLFAGGANGIAEAAAQAERLGLALTTAQGQDVEAMNDAFTMASQAVKGIVTQVVAYLSPAVKAIADTFTNMVGSIGGANIGQAIGDGIIAGARFLAGIGDWLIANLGGVWQYVSSVAAYWGSVMEISGSVGNMFAGVGRILSTAFLSLVRLVLTPLMFVIENVARLAANIPGSIGRAAGTTAEAVAGFREGLDQSIVDNATAVAENFSGAFSESASAAAPGFTGPLTTALDAAVAQAQASAAQVDEAGKGAATAITEAAQVAAEPQALKAVDSRSSEGIAEMFRIMRSTGADVQEQQLGVLEQIRDAIEGQEIDSPFAVDGA